MRGETTTKNYKRIARVAAGARSRAYGVTETTTKNYKGNLRFDIDRLFAFALVVGETTTKNYKM